MLCVMVKSLRESGFDRSRVVQSTNRFLTAHSWLRKEYIFYPYLKPRCTRYIIGLDNLRECIAYLALSLSLKSTWRGTYTVLKLRLRRVARRLIVILNYLVSRRYRI